MSKEVMDRLASITDDVVIEVSHLTKDYGKGRGIFDISFKIPKGCVFGYCGTNGSGKTTTLRHIMGFLKPDSGTVRVNGLDPWAHGEEIKKHVGYLPGEIAFPPVDSGSSFLRSQAELIGLTDMSKAERIINALQLDPTANLRRMSKGMKQKTAIVAAFMHSPDIILLDEPTTGLHFQDIDILMKVLNRIVDRGNTVIIIEHNLDVVKMADWNIDMGPEGGRNGGEIVAVGTPEQLVEQGKGYTAQYLKQWLDAESVLAQHLK